MTMIPKADLKLAKIWLSEAEAILIGASNGLSITEGLNIFACDAKFKNLFGDFYAMGVRNILEGLSLPYSDPQKAWGFACIFIK